MNEKHIRQQIREYLQIKGYKVVLLYASPISEKGMPDLLCYGPNGKMLNVEVKTAKGRQSDAQVEYEARITELGHTYILARRLEDVMDVL